MRNISLIFLLVLHTISCKSLEGQRRSDAKNNTTIKRNITEQMEILQKDNNIVKFNISCTTLAYNCPPITKPLCVKIRYKSQENKNKSVYVVMVNECEMDYLNMCYEGIKAAEIPMNNCEVAGIDGDASKTTHSRRKRSIDIVDRVIQPVTHGSVDMEQYNADCPKVCPSHDTMVCAQCQHGVYRSFVSVCHMRMYNCKNPKEKLRLISREACTMLSPYHEDLETMQGRVEEPMNDADMVLQFLWCKKWLKHPKAKIIKDHPWCKGAVHKLKTPRKADNKPIM